MAASTELQIDPEMINRYVAEMIIESSLGDALKKAIDEQVRKISSSYNNPFDSVVASALQEQARAYLAEPEMQERLRSIVQAKMTVEVIDTLLSKVISQGFGY